MRTFNWRFVGTFWLMMSAVLAVTIGLGFAAWGLATLVGPFVTLALAILAVMAAGSVVAGFIL